MPKHKIKAAYQNAKSTRWYKYVIRGLALLIILFIGGYFFMAWYVNNNRAELLALVTAQLNESIEGNITIERMDPALIQNFPRVSLRLQNVVITDSLFKNHNQVLLRAKDFNVSVNALALLRGAIEMRKIEITEAAIHLYTDSTGYSNTSVFKSRKNSSEGGDATYPEIKDFILRNVRLTIDNRLRNKLFDFKVANLKGDIDYTATGWDADIDVNTFVTSMAFSTKKGSFIKSKTVEGNLNIGYDETNEKITVDADDFSIADEDFEIVADFHLAKTNSAFNISIKNDEILWRNASRLLSPNISSRLDMFDLKEPIAVGCSISGDLNVAGDPRILVTAKVRESILETPGGTVTQCGFDGKFTNHFVSQKGNNDANSAIILTNFTGSYSGIPVSMKKTSILNLENPIAKGDFKSDFKIADLKNVIDSTFMTFEKGRANVDLTYVADIENFKIAKPIVEGIVQIDDGAMKYTRRNLAVRDIALDMRFTKNDLIVEKMKVRSGKSIIDLTGKIQNFHNLYYTAPEQIVMNWNVYSPQLHLAEFLGFLQPKKNTVSKNVNKQANFTQEINKLFDNTGIAVNLNVDRLYYSKFVATGVTAEMFVNDKDIVVRRASFKHGGGRIRMSGKLDSHSRRSNYNVNAIVSAVNISALFKSFNNFGIDALKSENIDGLVSVRADLSGDLGDNGMMVPNSMNGTVDFNLQNGRLKNFSALKSVGEIAFPNRNMENISISELDGNFTINGENVAIRPMQISSSVLNMDIQGIYSFGKGTEIFVDVPIRNPKRDKDITDEDELAKRRNRGIVLHLLAEDGKDGKVKVKLTTRRKPVTASQ